MSTLQEFLDVLQLEPAPSGDGLLATSVDEGHGVVFGGQLLAQTIVAAGSAMPDKEVKSVQLVFARGASVAAPLEIDVDVMHQGRAFGSVTVTISQGGRLCTRALVLLHAPDDDLIRHAAPAPTVTAAEQLAVRAPEDSFWDFRIVDEVDVSDPSLVGPPELDVWTRFVGAPDDLLTNQALLAYATDGFLIATAMRPHEGVGQSLAHVSISTTVLTHTLTFHEPFSAADWHLLTHRSDYAGRGRAYGRAHIYDTDDRLVASFVQESMVRDFPEGQRPAEGERSKH